MVKVVESSRGVKVGSNFCRLTVIGWPFRYGNSTHRAVVCECDCGTIVCTSVNSLIAGRAVSCGCKRRTHGASHSKLYYIWRAMRSRCQSSADHNYKRYGARGITVCREWRESYEAFARWAVGNGYKDGLSIDRKKSWLGYSPGNCEWVTREENSRRKQERERRSLSRDEVLLVRSEIAKGTSRKKIAKSMGIKFSTVSNIGCGASYANVT